MKGAYTLRLLGGPLDGMPLHWKEADPLPKQLPLPCGPELIDLAGEELSTCTPEGRKQVEAAADQLNRQPASIALYEQEGGAESTTYRFLQYIE